MAVITRYFSSSSAGAADGTSWANRAALLSAGSLNSIITSINFTTDSLEVMVEGGITYSITQSHASGIYTNAPNLTRPILFQGCDSSGNPINPASGWSSNATPFSTTSMPTFAYSTDIGINSLAATIYRGIRFTHSARTNAAIFSEGSFYDCCVESSSNNTSHSVFGPNVQTAQNCCLVMSGTGFSQISAAPIYRFVNCRFDGGTATNGTRAGISTTSSGSQYQSCTILNVVNGLLAATGATTRQSQVDRCLFVNCSGYAYQANGQASQTVVHNLSRSIFVNNGTAVDGNTNGHVIAIGNRLRNNTTNFANMGDKITSENDTSAGSDSDEFVDAASGDYRIKSTSSFWGTYLGPGDERVTAGGGLLRHPGMNGGFAA